MAMIGFESGTPGRKANTITTELKRILPNAVRRLSVTLSYVPVLFIGT